jgi:hypothetical protein
MTIDSHFPYSGSILRNSTSKDSYELYFNVIASTALSIKNHLETCLNCPDSIVISGDHAPPFVSEDKRNMFRKNVVPVYVFEKIKK